MGRDQKAVEQENHLRRSLGTERPTLEAIVCLYRVVQVFFRGDVVLKEVEGI